MRGGVPGAAHVVTLGRVGVSQVEITGPVGTAHAEAVGGRSGRMLEERAATESETVLAPDADAVAVAAPETVALIDEEPSPDAIRTPAAEAVTVTPVAPVAEKML